MQHVRFRKITRLLLVASAIAILAGCGGGGGGGGGSTPGDTTAPEPGASILFSNREATQVTVTWGEATDDNTSQAALEYSLYRSTENNLDSASDAIANGTLVMDWTADTVSYTATGLVDTTDYYFAVVVRDGSENMALYTQQPVTAGAQAWEPLEEVAFSAGTGDWTSLCVDGNGVPYVAYSDGDLGGRLTVEKFDGDTWDTVGPAGFSNVGVASGGAANQISLALDGDGVPYVAYADYDGTSAYWLTVRKYDSDNDEWDIVGTARFSQGPPLYVSLAVDPSGVPYVAYQDGSVAINFNLTVRKYTSGAWAYVGDAGVDGITTDGATHISLAFDSSGVPYVSYADGTTGIASVVKYVSGLSSWQPVGDDVSVNIALWTSLCLDSTDVPYVAYRDAANGNRLTVRKLNGSAWDVVGSEGFSANAVEYISLDIDLNDVPYVAYSDATLGAVLMKYDSGWSAVGGGAFSDGLASFTSLSIDPVGNPYVAYTDAAHGSGATVQRFY